MPAAGQVRIVLVDGPPNGFARLFVGPRDLVPALEQPVLVSGIPLFVGLDPASASALPGFLSLNDSGGLRLLAPDPGGDAPLIAVQLLLWKTTFGRRVYAIGANPRAARNGGNIERLICFHNHIFPQAEGSVK